MRSVLLIFLSLFLFFSACSNSLSPNELEVGTTDFRISLPEETHVNTWVENSYQTKVKTLLDKVMPAGTHAFPQKMVNKNGEPLPYGLYTLHIKTDTYSNSISFVYNSNFQ